jgi:hypothetical protein
MAGGDAAGHVHPSEQMGVHNCIGIKGLAHDHVPGIGRCWHLDPDLLEELLPFHAAPSTASRISATSRRDIEMRIFDVGKPPTEIVED